MLTHLFPRVFLVGKCFVGAVNDSRQKVCSHAFSHFTGVNACVQNCVFVVSLLEAPSFHQKFLLKIF